jgi:hypothetical protein
MTDNQAETSKACKECRVVKPLLDYPTRKDQPDGHHWWCFECKRAKDREYGKVHRDRTSDSQRRDSRRWERKPEVRERRRKQAVKDKYGLSQADFDAKLAEQGGRCPFCPADDDTPKEWHIDHDHEHCPGMYTCGSCLRDILCRRHNMGLGYFDDDPAQLRAAADYIEQHRARIQAAGAAPWQHRGVPSGEQHSNWQGDDASPGALRLRAWRALGAADHCETGCETGGRFEWVVRHGADPADLASYIPMCRSCSVRYMGQTGAGHANAKLTVEQVAEIRSRYVRGQSPTQTELAREYGVSQGVISSVIRGEKYVA